MLKVLDLRNIKGWNRLLESDKSIISSPLSTAPAFVMLLFIALAMIMRCSGVSYLISYILATVLSSAFVLLGTTEVKKNMGYIFFITLAISSMITALIFYRANNVLSVKSIQFKNASGKVLYTKEWKWRKSTVIQTCYGKCVVDNNKKLASLPQGSRITFDGIAYKIKSHKGAVHKKGFFKEQQFWYARKVYYKLRPGYIIATGAPSYFYRFRSTLRRRIIDEFPEQMSSYLLAFLLGEKSQQLSRVHRNTGTLHLLAVSGFHVGLLLLILGFILRRTHLYFSIISLLLWGYVALAGYSVGAIRAAIIAEIWFIGAIFGGSSVSFNSVSVASILLLIHNPFALFDVSFQLSVTASLVITGIYKRLVQVKVKAFWITSIVWIVTSSIVIHWFASVFLTGAFVNIVAMPLFSLIFLAMLIIMFMSFVHLDFIASPCVAVIESVFCLWEQFSDFVIGICPYEIVASSSLTALSILMFFVCCSLGSGISYKRTAFTSVGFTVLAIYCIEIV